ncbi:UV-damaged DNA-binding protein rad7 [Microbotryomycetes sp. JL221]|nr:UV-damaged DNA-binding protein rad7 [Microbotryomycetes sp. JL221]
MSRRRAAQQAREGGEPVINGPRSALTSFLHEQGITGPNAVPNYWRRQRDNAANGTDDDGPEQVAAVDDSDASTPATTTNGSTDAASTSRFTLTIPVSNSPSSSSPARSTTTTTAQVTPTTANLEASGSGTSSGNKRKLPTAAQTAAALKKKKKQQDADGEGIFDLAGQAHPAPKKGRYENRPPGSIAVCSDCGKKFTVTKYSATNPNGGGLLCSPCTNENIEDLAAGVKKAAVKTKPVKKKAVRAVEERLYRPIKTLQQQCIAVIGQHIGDVEALGDIGTNNMDKIAQIVCRNRALNQENLKLFLEASHTELRLYDCTSINDVELANIAVFCPRLERLTLNMCGRLDDDVLKAWAKGFKHLKYLSLYAPFLVTSGQWKEYLSTFGGEHQLEGFGLRQSARFDNEALQILVDRNPGLFNLQLSEIGKLNDSSLAMLHPLKNLTTLDISRAGVDQGRVLTDDAVVALIENVGENLIELVLDQNYLLTDRVLIEGVKIHCPKLSRLSLYGLIEIQSTGMQSLFQDWVNPGLELLNIHRCDHTDNEALAAIVSHSGHSLKTLNLHSCDNLEVEALMNMAANCPVMRDLDLSFVRMTDNFVIKACLDGMPELKKLFVHGDNRVTQDCPQRRPVSIRGLENCTVIEL